MDQQLASDLYEPNSRFLHVASCSSVYDGPGQLIVWGGQTSEFDSNDGRIQLASVVEQFDIHSEVWCQRDTGGTPHPGLSRAACTSFGNRLFIYGGYCDATYSNFSGALSCLDLTTLTWSQLSLVGGTVGGPMRKVGCGIVHFHHDKLAVIGGYGYPTGPTQPGSSFIRNSRRTDGRGWTNEIHVFDISQGVWFSPTVRGTRPPPCSAFTLTSIDNHRAVLFGGGQPGRGGVVNDLYLIDFNTMEFTKVEPREGEPWPVGRSMHAACCLGYAGDHIHLLVTGGGGRDGKTLRDIWLCDLSLKKWKEVTLPDGTLPRKFHSTTAITLCPGLVEVIVFGGSTEDFAVVKPASSCSRIAETTIITFGQIGSEWILVGVANNSQRGTSERVREKMLLKSGTDTQGPQLKFSPENQLTPYGLHRLEREGVQVRREISTKNKDFQAVLRLKQPDANLAIIKWTNSVQQANIKPTWKNLALVLHLINLDHLAEEINMYFTGAAVKQQLSGGTSSSIEQDPGSKGITEESLSEVFTLASLTQLEKTEGIPVLTELEAKNHEFQAIIRVKQPNLSWAINKWLTAPVLSRIKPTWKNLLSILRLVNLDHLAEDIETAGGDIKKLRDELLALCNKLKEGDDDENIHHLRSIDALSKSAIEQIKEKREMLVDLKTRQPSPTMIPPQLGTAEETNMVKTEPASPSVEDFDTSTQETVMTASMTTQPLVKKEPLEEALTSTATYSTGGDTCIEKLRDDMLDLFDKLKEGDIDENVHHLRYKTEIFSKSAIEQIQEMRETNEMLLVDLKTLQPSSILPQLGTAEETVVEKELETSTQETVLAAAMTTQSLVKKEPLEEDVMSTAIYPTADADVNTERDMLRMENQQLRSQLASVQSPEGIMETKPTPAQLSGFRGAEVCGKTAIVVTNNPQSFIWEGFGLKLHIPKGCLPESMEQCIIHIQASLAGQYDFPENSHLVSAVFWLRCEPKCVFQKQVSLEINHCAKSKNASKLSFVKALCTQQELPYTFRRVGGKFNQHSSYGIIDLESFSGMSVAQDESDEREYCAMLFYLSYSIVSHKIDFVIVWNSEAHLTVVKRDYNKDNASLGARQLVEFESNKITLNIPQEGITLDEGWKIMPQIAPVVMKKHVDNYRPGQWIPSCQLSAVFVLAEDKKIPLLQYQVKLVGAKEPFNMIAIEPPTISEVSRDDRKRPREQTDGDLLQSGPSPKKKPHLLDGNPDNGQGHITTEDVASQAGIGLDVLSQKCSEVVLLDVAKLCVEWQLIGQYLKLTEAEIAAVDGDKGTVEEKRIAMLGKWKEKFAYKATYQVLIEALLAAGKSLCAIDAAKIIGTADSGPLSTKTEPHPQSREYVKKKDDKPTLKYLMKELHPKVSDKWDDIGIELEVDDKLLVQIKKEYPGNSKQCLKEMLREWLRISNPPPFWEAIAQVVADVGDEELAAELRSKYCN